MHLSFKIGILALGMLVLASCKSTEELEPSEQGEVASEALVSTLGSLSQTTFDSYYSKLATSFKDSSRSVSFKTSTWMIADSAAYFLIKFANFPVASALMGQDSVTVLDRRSECKSCIVKRAIRNRVKPRQLAGHSSRYSNKF